MSAYNCCRANAFSHLTWRKLTLPFIVILGTVIALIESGCSEKKELSPIGEHVSRPTDAAYHAASDAFFVLNSNLNHTYDSGSVLALNRAGEKISATVSPRLGRSLSIAGDLLLASFDRESAPGSPSFAILYEISTSTGSPQLSEKKRWPLDDCSPINAVIRKNSPYIAVSCQSGKIFAGKLNSSDLSQSSLKLVRQFPSYVRRALHIDTRHNLLYAFVTDMGEPNLSDGVLTDKKNWDFTTGDQKGELIDGANEVPDDLEKTHALARSLKERGSPYQFVVYDLLAAEEADFPFKELHEVAASELRWLYFRFEQEPELNSEQKYYRTNFWQTLAPQATEASTEADSYFYLSHRGLQLSNKSAHANNIIKVSINPDRSKVLDRNLPTSDIFTFEKAFGAVDAQRNTDNYLGGFAIGSFTQGETFLINSFRDLVYFDKERYTITAAAVNFAEANQWQTTQTSFDTSDSYFQLAASQANSDQAIHVLTCSFYGDAIVLFKLSWGHDLELVKRID